MVLGDWRAEEAACSPAQDLPIPVCQKHVYILLTGAIFRIYENSLAISATGMNNLRPPSMRNLNR